jgi:hypothetical protein
VREGNRAAMDMTPPGDPRAAASPYAIGEAGRAARELAAGPPAAPAGQADAELTAATVAGMIIRAATVRGLLHRFNGTAGQDAFALARAATAGGADRAVAVVCDGVGALGRSGEAARLASRCLADLGAAGQPWPAAFARANDEVGARAKEALSAGSPDADLDGMATTAMAATVGRAGGEWVVDAAWVGDSPLWHLGADGQWSALAGLPDEDDAEAFHGTGVRPLPSAHGACTAGEFHVRGGAIFLMSDGVGDPLRWSGEVRDALARWWRRPPDPFSFAAQVGFARRSHVDDRTVIGIWPGTGEPDDTEPERGGPEPDGVPVRLEGTGDVPGDYG